MRFARRAESLGYQHKTRVEAVKIEETDYYECIEPMYRHFATGRIPARFWPPKDTPLYVWCMWQKYDCLRRALAANPFGCRSMYWLDLGIYHVATPPPSIAALFRQMAAAKRLRCTLLRQLSLSEIVDRPAFFSSLQQAVGGGLIGGPVEEVRWLREAFDREARASLQHYPVLDEALLAAIVLTHPDRFLPIYSGHKEMLQPRPAAQGVRGMPGNSSQDRLRDLSLELDAAATSARGRKNSRHARRKARRNGRVARRWASARSCAWA